MLTITKEFKFESSHRLFDPKLDDELNNIVFGKCANKPSHGHSYVMYVTISREKLIHGMIMNFSELKKIVNVLVEQCDHCFLNDVEILKGKITTCEVMVEEFWKYLEPKIVACNATLEELKLYETATSCATKKRESK